jgi:hypothetical protein
MLRGIGICSLLVCLVCASHSIVSAQVTFAPAGYNSGSTGTSSIANGDFNNDGILDLVTVNAGTLSFYKGIGAGKFAAPVSQPLPANLGQVVAADFNRDGKLDLAIASSGPVTATGSITILLGKGDGTFVPGANIAVAGTPLKIALGDFNGDHQPDVAASACNTSTCTLQVFLGQGNGTFTQSATLTAGGGWVAAGDFNADGRQDLAVIANGGNQLAMYLGNGNGTFQSPILANQNVALSLAVGDFYNNRIQSLAVLSTVPNNGNFNYYISTVRYVNGALAVTTPALASTDQFYSGIAAGDLNGDFIDDVVMVGGDVRSYPLTGYLLGKGDGTFQPYASAPAYGEGENFPFIRDLNLDSRHDIGTSWDSSYAGNGGGAFTLLNTSATKNCAPPKANALSVHICAPSNGQTVGQSFTFKAAGNAWNGVAKRMELWIDGRKVGQNLEDQLKVKAALTRGQHTASFVVVDTFDNHVSQSVSFTSSY